MFIKFPPLTCFILQLEALEDYKELLVKWGPPYKAYGYVHVVTSLIPRIH